MSLDFSRFKAAMQPKYLVAAVLAIAVLAGACFLYRAVTTERHIVRAATPIQNGETGVAVTRDIVIAFAHPEISQTEMRSQIQIFPAVLGTTTFNGKFVTITHEKNLEFGTQYVVRLPQNVEVRFTTEHAPMREISPYSYSAFNLYSLNAYSSSPQMIFNSYGEASSYHVELFQSSPAQLVRAAAELENVYGDEIAKTDFTKYYSGGALDSREMTMKEGTKYVPNIVAPGVYVVKISANKSPDANAPTFEKHPTHIFVVYTKIAHRSYRLGETFVSRVVDQRTGAGVARADVIAYDKKGEVLFKNGTDKFGLATRELSQDEKTEKPFMVEARAQGNSTFTRPNFNSDSYYKPDEHEGYIYTDRPLYTPGDTVHFKGIVRPANPAARPRAGAEFTVKISQDEYGSGSAVLYEKKLAVNEFGSFADKLKLTTELRSGDYRIQILDGETSLGSTRFSVEYYQKPDFNVGITLSRDEYVRGNPVKVTVKPTFYFGGAVTEGTVEAVISTYGYNTEATASAQLGKNGATLEIPTANLSTNQGYYDNYGSNASEFFVDVTVIDSSGRRTTESKSFTLHTGEYDIERVNPQELWYVRSADEQLFTYKATRIGGAPEAGRELTLTVQKDLWSYGEKEREQNTTTYKLKTNAAGEVSQKIKFPSGGYYLVKIVGADALKNEIVNTAYVWVTGSGSVDDTNDVDDKIFISFDKKEYKIGETARVTLELPRAEGDLFWSVNKKKFHRMEVRALSGKQINIEVPITEDLVPGFYFYADMLHGEQFVSESQQVKVIGKKLNITVTPPQEKTKPGQNVSVQVRTTDDAGAPVSAETSVSVVDKALLALKADQSGSIYNALHPMESDSLRTADSLPAIGNNNGAEMGCFTGDTKILMAGGSVKQIKDVRVGDRILTRPTENSNALRDDLVVKTFVHQVDSYLVINKMLNVTPEHRVLINGVWMQMSEARVGDWMLDAAGNHVTIHSIETRRGNFTVYNLQTEIYHTFIANGIYVHNDKGGGPAAATKRSHFVDTAYWNAFVTTDATGNAAVTFTLPDNTTTWAIASKGVSDDGLAGDAKAEFLTTKPVVVRPVLPQFVRVGDVITIKGAVHNATGSERTFKTLLTASGAAVQDETIKNLKVKHGADGIATWKLQIGQGTQLKISLSAVGGDEQDAVELTLPIYEPFTQIANAYSGNEPGTYSFSLVPGSEQSRATAKITIAPSVAAVLPEVIAKLVGFPYGCVEQTMSHHLPNILAARYSGLGIAADKTKLQDSLNEGFDRLGKFQHSDGGFGWWEHDENNVWMSGYVYEGLWEAKQAGVLGGREQMYTRLGDYLKKKITEMKPDEQAYIAYVLAKAEPNSTRELSDTLARDISKQDIQSVGYIALAEYYNGNKDGAKQLMQKIKAHVKDGHWELDAENDYHGALKDKYSATGVNLLAVMTIAPDETLQKNVVQWLMQHRNGYDGLWGSTRQSAQILFALVKYLESSNELSPSYTYTVTVNGAAVKSGKMSSTKDQVVIPLSAKNLQSENSVVITKKGTGNLYWSVQTAEFLNADALARVKNDMPITREYLDEKGAVKTSFALGDRVRVRLKFTPPKKDSHYLMIEDYLPAAFEPLNTNLDNSGSGAVDRWWWYDEMDIRDHKVAVFRSYVSGGENNIEYDARVMFRGTFAAPAPVASFMYEPDIHGFGVPAGIQAQ